MIRAALERESEEPFSEAKKAWGQRRGRRIPARRVPDVLYRRLKAVAAGHRRMNQEAILALEAGLPESRLAQRPTLQKSLRCMEQQVWTLPVLDQRSAEEILGYGDGGLDG